MRRLVLILAIAGLPGLLAAGAGRQERDADLFVLEVPELALRVAANASATLPHGNVTHLRVHIRKPPSQVSYGSIFARINTESANVVMTTRSTAEGMACDFDLTRRDGFRLQPGRNSVEIAVQDARRRLYYASFLLDTTARAADTAPTGGDVPIVPLSGRKFAVVVGISRYRFGEQGLKPLAFADRDAASLSEFLLSPEGGAFAREHVRLLMNEDATVAQVRSALFEFLAQAGADDLVVIFFSGHGVPEPADPRNLYLLAHDSNPDDLGSTALPLSALEDLYGRVLKAPRVVTMVDACRVSALARGAAAAVGNNLVHQYLARFAGGSEKAVVAAADVGEVSWEADTFGGGHGAFAHFLLRGLRGDADRNRDGTVTVGEARAYVRDQVRRATGGQQNPFGVAGPGDGIPLAGLRARK